MKGSSKWAHRQQPRNRAVAYGCYLPGDDPNPLDLDRDGAAIEVQAALDRRHEARQVIEGIRQASKGRAMLGKWKPDK